MARFDASLTRTPFDAMECREGMYQCLRSAHVGSKERMRKKDEEEDGGEDEE